MVKMGMGDQDEVQGSGPEIKGGEILSVGLAPALKHAAVDDEPGSAIDQAAGTGDLGGSALKGEEHDD